MEQDTKKIKEIAYALMIASVKDKLNVPGEYLWNIPQEDTFGEIRSKSWSVFSSGNCVKDIEVLEFINNIDVIKFLKDPWISKKFEEYFPAWIKSCGRYNLKGFDEFKYGCFAQGSQEYFLNFYIRNRNKRFRICRGEYWWHMEVWERLNIQWKYLDQEEINENDVVIISTPFALTGKVHREFQQIIDQCDKKNVEVMLDFIYLPNVTLNNLTIDLDHDCIRSISFSMSKTFPVQNAKIAIRFTRQKLVDPMQISNDENVANRLACGLGLEVMKQFEVDYMVKKYHAEQQNWCRYLGLIPTDVVHFATGQPFTEEGRTKGKEFFSKHNTQDIRYNLGPLFENKSLLINLGLYQV